MVDPQGPERFGVFAELFTSGTDADRAGWYLKLLGLRTDDAGAAVQAVARCLATARRPRDEVEAMLVGGGGWRAHLVGCVAALAADPEVRPVEAVARLACSYSWASPQVLATASLIGPGDWAARAERAIIEMQGVKAAAAFSALVDPVPPQVRALAERDIEGGGLIARRWRQAVAAVFDDAGIDRDW